jgi:hypothetical protein
MSEPNQKVTELTEEQEREVKDIFKTLEEEQQKELEDNLKTLAGLEKDELPYTVRKKLIYKGKMAPAGCMYVVVKGTIGWKEKKTVEAFARIRGKLSPEAEKELCEDLWKLCNEEHKSI